MVRVKICGITTIDDALLAVDAGADAIGLVFYEKSPRNLTREQAATIVRSLPPFVQAVGLFVNAAIDHVNDTARFCGLDLVQLHGDESPEYCGLVERRVVKAFRIRDVASLEPIKDYRVAGFLLDTWSPDSYGGTGTSFNWEIAREAAKFGPVILAGGLTAGNVVQAVETAGPYGVDVSSGVESSPGKKDPAKVREFIRKAKGL